GAIDEQITHAGRDDRSRLAPRLFEQRQNFVLKLAPPERKQPDEDAIGTKLSVQRRELSFAILANLVHRRGGVTPDQLAVRLLDERRQRDRLDAVWGRYVGREGAAANE